MALDIYTYRAPFFRMKTAKHLLRAMQYGDDNKCQFTILQEGRDFVVIGAGAWHALQIVTRACGGSWACLEQSSG